MQRQEFEQEQKQNSKNLSKEYKTIQGVIQATKDIILEAFDHEYLLEIEDKIFGLLN
jgi:hypothetical protein